jgi:UDP-N-acetylmuramoyl-tripeptide--D-alanyl-D-alanine ligase
MKTNTLLAILQQSEYDWQYFLDWHQAHEKNLPTIKPHKWTIKLKIIKLITKFLFILPPLINLKLALFLFKILELPARFLITSLAKIKLIILQKQGLVIVAIAGSYGKTSVKHIMAHTLKKQTSLLATPKSVNTPLGISQIVLQKLTKKHQLFIVELGEYYVGDIKKLTNFINPNFGIMTPVGAQHLERMGSIENIALTMTELSDYFKNKKSNLLIAQENEQFFDNTWRFYGSDSQSDYQIKEASVARRGTDFIAKTPHLEIKSFSPLYGKHQAINLLPSLWLANELKLDVEKTIKTAASLPYLSRRHKPTFAQNNVLILDNSYNTNPSSIKASLDLINQLDSSNRIIITLGFVELGKESDKFHHQLGKLLAKKVDYVGLVKSRWNDQVETGYLEAGGKKSHFITATNPDEALQLLRDNIKSNSIILMEGGYQEIFT